MYSTDWEVIDGVGKDISKPGSFGLFPLKGVPAHALSFYMGGNITLLIAKHDGKNMSLHDHDFALLNLCEFGFLYSSSARVARKNAIIKTPNIPLYTCVQQPDPLGKVNEQERLRQ